MRICLDVSESYVYYPGFYPDLPDIRIDLEQGVLQRISMQIISLQSQTLFMLYIGPYEPILI